MSMGQALTVGRSFDLIFIWYDVVLATETAGLGRVGFVDTLHTVIVLVFWFWLKFGLLLAIVSSLRFILLYWVFIHGKWERNTIWVLILEWFVCCIPVCYIIAVGAFYLFSGFVWYQRRAYETSYLFILASTKVLHSIHAQAGSLRIAVTLKSSIVSDFSLDYTTNHIHLESLKRVSRMTSWPKEKSHVYIALIRV